MIRRPGLKIIVGSGWLSLRGIEVGGFGRAAAGGETFGIMISRSLGSERAVLSLWKPDVR